MTPDAAPSSSRWGRALRRFLRDLPAVGVALHVAGMLGAHQGLPERGVAVAAIAFVAILALLLIGLRVAWRRPRWRLALTVLFAAHVLFWTARGLLHANLRVAGDVVAGTASVWQGPPQAFLAGVGVADFRLEEGDTLAGYGAAPRRVAFPWLAPGPLARASLADMGAGAERGAPRVPMLRRGTKGPVALGARALVLRPTGTGPTVALVRLDLVLCDARVRDAIRQRVADLGVVDATLVVCATHTHSGPGGFACGCLAQIVGTDHLRPDVVERVVAAADAAVRQAHGSAVPARIAFARARDVGAEGKPLLAANRSAGDPDRLDTEVLGVRLDAAADGRRIALLLNYSVHPVWGRPADTVFSPDLSGALEASRALSDGAVTIFVNGAEGDVKPRVRPDRTRTADPLAAFEAAVAPRLRAPAEQDRLRVVAATVRRDFGSPHAVHALLGERGPLLRASTGPFGATAGDAVAAALLLPVNALWWSACCDDARLVATFDGGFGVVANLDPWLDHARFPVSAITLETPTGTAVLLGLPGEATTALGEQIKAEGRLRRAEPVYVLGLANDHMAYVATPDECDVGTYEGRMTLFGRETSERLVESVAAALDAVGLSAPAEPK